MALRTDYDDAIVVTLVAALMLVAVVSLIVYIFFPSLGRLQEWEGDVLVLGSRLSGVAGHPNVIGRISGLCVILVVIHWRDLRQLLGRTILSFGTASSFLALVLSQSRTAMAIVIALLGLHFAFRKRYLPFLMISGAVAATVLATFVSNDVDQFLSLLARSGDPTEIETGASRVQVWATIIKLAQSKFWTGWGYASTGFILPAYSEYVGFPVSHAHNLWLELWFATGMIGVTLFSVALVGQITHAVAHRDGPNAWRWLRTPRSLACVSHANWTGSLPSAASRKWWSATTAASSPAPPSSLGPIRPASNGITSPPASRCKMPSSRASTPACATSFSMRRSSLPHARAMLNIWRADYNDSARTRNSDGRHRPSSLRPSLRPRGGLWRCAPPKAPRRRPSLRPPFRASKTPETNARLDKTWRQGQGVRFARA
jgi:hypothetical protein